MDRKFEEVEGGYYDQYNFYYTPDGSFWDADGFYFNKDGVDKNGGYYDEQFKYVPAKIYNKKINKKQELGSEESIDDDFLLDDDVDEGVINHKDKFHNYSNKTNKALFKSEEYEDYDLEHEDTFIPQNLNGIEVVKINPNTFNFDEIEEGDDFDDQMINKLKIENINLDDNSPIKENIPEEIKNQNQNNQVEPKNTTNEKNFVKNNYKNEHISGRTTDPEINSNFNKNQNPPKTKINYIKKTNNLYGNDINKYLDIIINKKENEEIKTIQNDNIKNPIINKNFEVNNTNKFKNVSHTKTNYNFKNNTGNKSKNFNDMDKYLNQIINTNPDYDINNNTSQRNFKINKSNDINKNKTQKEFVSSAREIIFEGFTFSKNDREEKNNDIHNTNNNYQTSHLTQSKTNQNNQKYYNNDEDENLKQSNNFRNRNPTKYTSDRNYKSYNNFSK